MKHVKTFGRGEEGKEMYVKVKRGDKKRDGGEESRNKPTTEKLQTLSLKMLV